MLEKITLVIPTNNRHSHLERILNYYKYIDLKILIADSTRDSFTLKKKSNIYSHIIFLLYPYYDLLGKQLPLNSLFHQLLVE